MDGRGGGCEDVERGVPGDAVEGRWVRREAWVVCWSVEVIWRWRLSVAGRNLAGVWYTEGAEEGGLNISVG